MKSLSTEEFLKLMNAIAEEVDDTQVDNVEDLKDDVEELSLIEQVIENFLADCVTQRRLPTISEAEVLKILDDILVKYED